MLLTRKELNKILRNWRISSIPDELKRELLAAYGHEVLTLDGRTIEYSEQDIIEQLRKILRPYQEPGELPDDVALAFRQIKKSN